jgi:hypothetical protein
MGALVPAELEKDWGGKGAFPAYFGATNRIDYV